jgi:hypothetical protein
MPTKFYKCDECYEDSKNLLEIEQLLLKMKIPRELCTKIISFNFPLKLCTCCNKTKLCPEHYIRAKHYGNYYRRNEIMCDACCWWEVS